MEFSVVFVFLAILAAFWLLALASKGGRAIGLIDGQLARCVDKPNCVCTEYADDTAHYYQPLPIPENINGPDIIQNAVISAIEDAGGTVEISSHTYISATFESRIFGFVDDFEVRIDLAGKAINMRSASRVGHSDFGANLKRVKLFDDLLHKRLALAL